MDYQQKIFFVIDKRYIYLTKSIYVQILFKKVQFDFYRYHKNSSIW
jgi:hypothetical protein